MTIIVGYVYFLFDMKVSWNQKKTSEGQNLKWYRVKFGGEPGGMCFKRQWVT